MSILSVSGLSKSFGGVLALRGVSFSVAAGEVVALIGPNGAGKSTCFNLINGQLPPDAGRIELNGHDLAHRTPREICALGVGRTFQVAASFGSMTVRENVQVAALAAQGRLRSPVSGLGDATAADALVAQVGMDAQAARPFAELSYGDLKRVELAVALASRPRLLLMDEPTAGMAAGERDALMSLVIGIARRESLAVLFTEHDVEVVFRCADRVIVLSEGSIIARGAPADIRADAEVRRLYLGTETAHA